MLLITPVDAQPAMVVKKALKMFDGETQKSGVNMRFVLANSYKDLKVDWVRLDPSRLLQVLINLASNAIKFTQSEARREIRISLAASLTRPAGSESGFKYLPVGGEKKDPTLDADWGTGEEIYLKIECHDTGRGLNEQELKLLFQRFSQASPRTHVQYGGSGLGLFISRELTELQGGEIGVASEAGVGSTFAFYVKARRSTVPYDHESVNLLALNNACATTSPVAHRATSGVSTSQISAMTSSALAATRHVDRLPSEAIRHVLIVEDNLVNQKVLSKQLRNAGYVVEVANHGGEALAVLEQSHFWKDKEQGASLCIVLMDLEMPVMDGLTCVRKIRELQETGDIVGHVPVIAVTANARTEQMTRARECGMVCALSPHFYFLCLYDGQALIHESGYRGVQTI